MADTPDLDRQPAPAQVPGAVSSHDLVVADLARWEYHELTRSTISLLAERKVYGLGKYGVVLHPDNGRDHAQDAEDEVVDLAVYLRTWMAANPELRPLLDPIYLDTLWTMVIIRQLRTTGYPPEYHMRNEEHGPLAHLGNEVLAIDGELSEEDTGRAMMVFDVEVCGGRQRNDTICIRSLAYRTCSRHGERGRVS